MNSLDLKQYMCRICLDNSVVLNWNTQLCGYSDFTYKDCFYKYTQLEYLESDPLSPMLCQICLNGLDSTHSLILKALESHKYFCDTNPTICIDQSTKVKGNIKYMATKFETILVEKIKLEPDAQEHFIYENSDEDITLASEEIKGKKSYSRCKGAKPSTTNQEKSGNDIIYKPVKSEMDLECVIGADTSEYKLEKSFNESIKKSRRKSKGMLTRQTTERDNNTSDVNDDQEKTQIMALEDTLINDIIKDSDEHVKHKVVKHKRIKQPRMCSICSKILQGEIALQLHEKTHIENRERKETCKVCGLKFYDKRNLYAHKRIHAENREKNHKCEFCNKAFYNKGGLNIHRRVHLGQMIPCNLCTKEFFRQIDLERHMSSHSATTINSATRKKIRYFVRCKQCDKSILSTSFKSHTAAHLNEPLMKCTICNKEFFRRKSCVVHVKKVHQKTNDEYNDFIIQYKNNRISHLFLEQKADIQLTDD